MANSQQNMEFITDLQDLLTAVNISPVDDIITGADDVISQHVKEIKERADNKSYRFLADNSFAIEKQFNHMFDMLKQHNTKIEFWLACYYCARLAHRYYLQYGNEKLADDYLEESKKLQYRCEKGRFQEKEDDDFLRAFQKKLAKDLGLLASTPQRTTKIREWLGFINIYRIEFLFCRLTVREAILFANDMQWLEKLGKFLGLHFDVDRMVSIINAPTSVFNLLSVGLFAARFLLNAALIVKHTFFYTDDDKELTTGQRLWKELYARHCTMLNDIAWGVTNLLCNYSSYFNVSAPVANWLTAGFLLFDVALLLYRRFLAEQEYLFMRDQYLAEKQSYADLLNQSLTENLQALYQARVVMIDKQLEKLERDWQVESETLLFNAAAAALALSGFSASLLLTGPAVAVVCFFVCSIAIAMYLSAGAFEKYRAQSLLSQKLESDPLADVLSRETAREEAWSAGSQFILTMVKNIFMPMLIVTTFAVCWEAAVVLTAAYVAYEYLSGFFVSPPVDKKAKPLDAMEVDAAVEPQLPAMALSM